MKKRRWSKKLKFIKKLPTKRIAIISIVCVIALLLLCFRDTFFSAYPEIVTRYRTRYLEMANEEYLAKLRNYTRYVLWDPIDGLNFTELMKWLRWHLYYFEGPLLERREMPIEILSTNILGTVTLYNGGYRIAIYSPNTNQYKVFLGPGESPSDIAPNSFDSWHVALGRCGEFALLYTGLCLANNIRVRIVVDCSVKVDNRTAGDHVWNEVWFNDTWIHVDATIPCINEPDVYANPNKWGKCVNCVYAIEGNTITDVTQTYAGS